MKKTLSIFVAIIIILTSPGIFPTVVFAQQTVIYENAQTGRILETVSARFVTKGEKDYSYTQKKGKKLKFSKNSKVSVMGRSSESKKYFYIKKKVNKKVYYGYINEKYISVNNSKNYTKKTSKTVTNPYTKKKCKYSYYEYKGLPFYHFNQMKSGSINGLKISCSCGPHSLATVLSALTKQVIAPEELMKKMSKNCIVPSKKGTYLSKLTDSICPYINSNYNYTVLYKKIKPSQTFDYLKKGYFVIVGVENTDDQALFTSYSHYITLVGYDATGNIMTMNTNGKTAPFESFSKSRIEKYLRNTDFYKENTVAIKYKFDDSFNEFDETITAKATKNTKIYEHKQNCGFYSNIKKGKKVTVIGKSGNYFFVEYTVKGEKQTGFIPISSTNLYVEASLSNSNYTYDNKTHIPSVTVSDSNGNKLIEGEDYTVTYKNQSSKKIGEYKITLKYSKPYYGKKTLTYKIVPKESKILSLKGLKSKIKVKFKKSENISGYQIEYSRFKNFKKSKAVNIGKNSSKKTVKTTFSKQKYYVRIRTYKTVGKTKYYSSWSKAKTVKTK